MAGEDRLVTLECDTEEEYIQEFCTEYRDEIHTPDGFIIFCNPLRTTAIHVCRGGKFEVFQKERARRILWAKYILLNPSERIILKNIENNNILFFLTRKKNPYIVVCKKIDHRWILISAHLVGGKRAEEYRNGKVPFIFYSP